MGRQFALACTTVSAGIAGRGSRRSRLRLTDRTRSDAATSSSGGRETRPQASSRSSCRAETPASQPVRGARGRRGDFDRSNATRWGKSGRRIDWGSARRSPLRSSARLAWACAPRDAAVMLAATLAHGHSRSWLGSGPLSLAPLGFAVVWASVVEDVWPWTVVAWPVAGRAAAGFVLGSGLASRCPASDSLLSVGTASVSGSVEDGVCCLASVCRP
jgi:hypothetical protein